MSPALLTWPGAPSRWPGASLSAGCWASLQHGGRFQGEPRGGETTETSGLTGDIAASPTTALTRPVQAPPLHLGWQGRGAEDPGGEQTPWRHFWKRDPPPPDLWPPSSHPPAGHGPAHVLPGSLVPSQHPTRRRSEFLWLLGAEVCERTDRPSRQEDTGTGWADGLPPAGPPPVAALVPLALQDGGHGKGHLGSWARSGGRVCQRDFRV